MLWCKLLKEVFEVKPNLERIIKLERELLKIKMEILRQPILDVYICILEFIDRETSETTQDLAKDLDEMLYEWRVKAEKSGKTLDCVTFMQSFKAGITSELLNDDFLANRDLRLREMKDAINKAWREKVDAVHKWTVIDKIQK